MQLNELNDKPGSRRPKKRLGRGMGSGTGKTSARGQKGQKSRSGVAIKGFEGGQMPIHMRLPKRGFNNIFRKTYVPVNTGRVQAAIDAGKLDAAQKIDEAALLASGVVRRAKDGIRLLAKGELTARVEIEVAGASAAAVAQVEAAGGTIAQTAQPTEEQLAAKAKKAETRRTKVVGKGHKKKK
jgi:large subunit ribosomal protein L15